MKIVTLTSSFDSKRLSKLVDLMIGFGGLQGHSMLFVPTPSAAGDAAAAADRLKPLMMAVDVVQTHEEFSEIRPHINQNKHFAFAMRHLEKTGNTETILLMEPDCAPCDFGWLNSLERGYKMAGKLFVGNLVPFPFLVDGRLSFRPNEEMMMGVGMYHGNIRQFDSMKPIMDDLGKGGHMAPPLPFDQYLRGELRRLGWAHTDLIADMWDTHQYTEVDGKIKGISRREKTDDGRPVRQRAPIDKGGAFVEADAVLIHGCKDDSLYDILIKRIEEVSKKKVEEEAAKPVVPVTPKLTKDEQFARQVMARYLQADKQLRVSTLAIELDLDKEVLTAQLESAGFKVERFGWIKPVGM